MKAKHLKTLERVSQITGFPLETLVTEFEPLAHEAKRQVTWQLERILKNYPKYTEEMKAQVEETLHKFVGNL